MPTLDPIKKQVVYSAGEALPAVGSPAYKQAQSGVVPTALSSTRGSDVITQNLGEHSQDMTMLQNGSTTKTTNTTTPAKDDTGEALKRIGGISAAEANATGVKLDDYTYDTSSGYFIPKSNTQIGGLERQYQQDEDQVNRTFDQMNASFDASTQNLINTYVNIFGERIRAQEDANKRELAAFDTMNTRFGTTRYAPGVAQGVLTADERVGLDRIKAIVMEEAGLISKAQQDLQDKKYTSFVQRRNEIKEIRKEKKTEIDKLLQIAQDEQKKAKEKEIQSSRDAVIANLVKQGIKDPAEIMGLLQEQAAAQGTKTDFTADEIEKALKVFSPDATLAGLSPDFKTYKYLQDIKDPSVAGMDFFQFQRAITNAKDTTPNDGVKPITLTPEKKTKLLGAGFSAQDVNNIEADIQKYGLDKVLEGITDTAQKKALQDAYGVKEKVTIAQLETTVTQKQAQDALKDTYTTDELKDLADKAGVWSFWTGKDSDIERWLNSEDAKKTYVKLLYEQYKSAGMAE